MGPNYSISTACATSNFCILNAANHIIRGEAVSTFYALATCIHKSLYTSTSNMLFFYSIYMILQDVMLCGGSDAAIIPIGIYPLLV